MTRVAAVVVSFNTREVLRACLESLRAAEPSEIVVVDSGSTDGTLDMLEQDFGDVHLVRTENRGYGAAANAGFQATTEEYVLLLNSDTRVAAGAPEAVAAYLDAHPEVGIVGPRLVNPDGSLQGSCFPYPSPRTAFLGETGLGYLIRFVPVLRTRHPRTWRHDTTRPMPWVSGAAMGIRRTAHRAVAGFDETYFMYFEETDLCYRMWRTGWEVHFAPVTVIMHLGAASTSHWAAAMRLRYYESMARFYRAHRDPRDLLALDVIIRTTAAVRLLITWSRLWATRRGERQARLRQDAVAWARLARAGVRREGSASLPVGPVTPAQSPAVALRRLDWRFLLPVEPPTGRSRAVLLGATPALANRLEQAGFARLVSTSLSATAGDVDAVLVLDGDGARPDLERGASALRSGGVLYVELRAPPWRISRRAAHAERAARAAGLALVGRYAVLPTLAAAKVYLPLETPHALRWVVKTLVPASTPQRRLFLGIFRFLGPQRLARLLPLYPARAFVAVREPGDDTAPAPFRAAGLQGQSQPLVLCDAGNRVVMLPFKFGDASPTCVLKVPKLPVFNARTRNEQERLAEIREHVPPRLRAAMPEPLGLVPLGEITMALERFRPGESLMVSSGARPSNWRRQSRDLRLAADWLVDLHTSAPIRSAVWDDEQREMWVDEPVRQFRQSFGVTSAEVKLLDAFRRRSDTLTGAHFPVVWWHRDYNIWNLFRDGDRLSVIDWEGARPGPPLCDLLHFCTHWYEAVHGHRTEPAKLVGFRNLFLGPQPRDRAAAATHEAIAGYLQRLELDPGFYPLLLVFTWVELALRRAEQRRDQGEPDPDSREGNRNFPFIAALAEGFFDRQEVQAAAPRATNPAGTI